MTRGGWPCRACVNQSPRPRSLAKQCPWTIDCPPRHAPGADKRDRSNIERDVDAARPTGSRSGAGMSYTVHCQRGDICLWRPQNRKLFIFLSPIFFSPSYLLARPRFAAWAGGPVSAYRPLPNSPPATIPLPKKFPCLYPRLRSLRQLLFKTTSPPNPPLEAPARFVRMNTT